MSERSIFETLAQQVAQEAQRLTSFFNENGYYQPDFKQGGFTEFDELPPDIEASRKRLQAAAKAVHDLAAGPVEYVKSLARSYHDASTLRWLIHFKIPKAIPLRGPIPYAEVAKKCGVNESILRRMVKYAMTNHLFYEPSPGELAHTAHSAVLVGEEAMAEVEFEVEEGFPTSAKLVEAHEKWGSDRDDEKKCAFQLAWGTDMGVEEYYAQEGFEDRKEIVDTSRPDPVAEKECLIRAFAWDQVKRVVDVAGGKGETAIALARRFPSLRLMVQDSTEVIELGQQSLPEESERKVYFVGHDVFKEDKSMPDEVFGAQVYLLRNVLSKCSDEKAKVVLSNVAELLQDGDGSARCLVLDRVLSSPVSSESNDMEQQAARHRDLQGLEMYNGTERNRQEWEVLVQAADENLRVVGVRPIEESAYAVLEVAYVDE